MTSGTNPAVGRHTIVYTSGGGRWGNQLLMFAHLIGLVEEHPEFRVIQYSNWPYADLTYGTEKNPKCEYPDSHSAPGLAVRVEGLIRGMVWERRQRAANRLLGRSLHYLMPWRSIDYVKHLQEISFSDPALLEKFRSRRVTYLAGWQIREWDWLDKHQQAVREFLAPAARFDAVAKPFMRQLREKHKTIVGIVIRQAEYRIAMDGRFFFPSEQYVKFLKQLRERFGPDAALLIATDEKQPVGIYDEIGVHWCTGEKAGTGHYAESLAELSMCDLVVSVPSTFSAWAAFQGNIPILPISSADDDLRQIPLLQRHIFDARHHPEFANAVK